MVATLSSVSSSGNAGKYFYFTENNFECSKSWHSNKAKEELHLKALTRKSFEDILNGKLDKDTTLGRKTKDGIKHHPGQELILSAPKSVSIMALIAKDERVIDAHERAVSTTLDYIQRHMIYTRVQTQGKLCIEKTDNAPIAKFTHMTSRPPKSSSKEKVIPDPQLHTHNIIANATFCLDNKWRSIVFDSLYENQMNIGEIYRIELAQEIEKFGYRTEVKKDRVNRWNFEIKGVPIDTIKEFSQRRKGIVEKTTEMGATQAEAIAYIAKITREDKTVYSKDELQTNWESRADLELIKQIKEKSFLEAEKSINSNAAFDKYSNLDLALKSAVESLSEREATFKPEDLHTAIIENTERQYNISQIERIISQKLDEGVLLQSKNSDTTTYTTAKNLKLEKDTVKLMLNAQNRVKAILPQKEIRQLLENSNLNQGQKDATTLILNSRDRVIGIQGSAGTAKTSMLNTSRALVQTRDYEMIGLAPTREAANVLKEATSMNTQTLHLFLARYDGVLKGRGTFAGREQMKADFKNKIVVLDESSLASTKHIKNLITLSQELKFRLVLVGDIKQLGSIESGKPFDTLQKHGMNTAILRDIKRQQNDELLKSVYAAAGSVDQKKEIAREAIYSSLKAIGKDNIIDLAIKKPSTQKLVEATYQRWVKESNKSGKDILVVAPSNQLRQEINNKIRIHFVKGEELDQQVLHSKNLTHAQSQNIRNYTKEDIIFFNKQNKNLGIEKNNYYKILEINQENGDLVLAKFNQKNNEQIKWSPAKALSNNPRGLIEVYEKDILKIGLGESIRWTKNSKTHKFIVNGSTATIKDISNSKITFKVGDSVYKLSKKDSALMHMDHAYCSTVYSSEGKTVDIVIGIARSRELLLDLTTQRSFYVTLSRARVKAILVTDSYNGLIRRLSEKTGDKSSAIEHQELNMTGDSVNLKTEGRNVFIEKDGDSNDAVSNNSLKLELVKNVNNGKNFISTKETLDSFINNPNRIREVAISLFGPTNNKVSRGDNLRFGKKGSIAVKISSGKWYDFESGEGGNLYSLAKNNKLLHTECSSQSRKNSLTKVKNSERHMEAKAEESAKLFSVNKLLQSSIPINKQATLANSYLEKHRNIKLKEINLSDDLRYTEKAWSSETNSFHPALLSVARDKDGSPRAIQSIYLDPSTSNKNKRLEVSKRSQGILRGSFVELTKNREAKIIFIAEGIETALSVAKVKPEARIICSLGISNIKNIDLSKTQNLKNKTVIICADNDGKDSSTKATIERASIFLKEQGIGTVAIIRPDIEGQDFNDVLKTDVEKVKGYIDPILDTYPDYQKKDMAIKQEINCLNEEKILIQKVLETSSVYKDAKASYRLWKNLVREKGDVEALKQAKIRPALLGKLKGASFLGLENKARIEAISKVSEFLEKLTKLSNIQKLEADLKQQNKELCSEIKSRYLKKLSSFSIKNLDHKELSFRLEKLVQHSLAVTDRCIDHKAVKFVTNRMTEQILQYRQRYRKEPTDMLRQQYFLRARHELSRQSFMESYLNKSIPKNNLESRILKSQQLGRLLAIDSKLAQESSLGKNQIYYNTPHFDKVLESYKEGEGKISLLEHSFLKEGMNEVKANFIAAEVVKYEEKTGQHMPLRQQESLKAVGDYVTKNYNDLLKYGFSKAETQIAYMEGSKLALNYISTKKDLEISKSDIKLTQEDIKSTIERHGFQKEIKTVEQSKQANSLGIEKNSSIERGKEGIEIEL